MTTTSNIHPGGALVRFGDLKRHYQLIQAEIDRAISEVLHEGWFILGKRVQEFEERFSQYCGVSYGVGVGSGTEALHLALVACGIQPGSVLIAKRWKMFYSCYLNQRKKSKFMPALL